MSISNPTAALGGLRVVQPGDPVSGTGLLKTQHEASRDGLRLIASTMRYVASDLAGTELGRGLERQAIRLCLRAQELETSR